MPKISVMEFYLFYRAIRNHAIYRAAGKQPTADEIEEVWRQFGNGELTTVVSHPGVWFLEPTKGAKRFDLRRKHKPVVAMRAFIQQTLVEIENEPEASEFKEMFGQI